MPNVEANNTHYDSNKEGMDCAVDKLRVNQNRQSINNNEEFASEIHLGANLETNESNNTFGEQTDKRNQRPVSERTAWN